MRSASSALPGWARRVAASLAAQRLPADRHYKWLNVLRLAKGFIASAEMDADERYRSYLQVLVAADGRRRCCCSPPAGDAMHWHAAFAAAGDARRTQPHVRGRRRNPAARRPADADRQDEHGGVAGMPRAAARPRTGRAGRRRFPATPRSAAAG